MRDLPEDPEAAAPQQGRATLARRSRPWRLSPASSLTRRIVFINLIGLGLLVGGVLYLNQFRAGLIELRAQALRTQGEIIAIAVSEAAGLSGDLVDYDPIRANFVLRRLAQPAGVRARLFDRRGRLTGDTRSFSAPGAPVAMRPLPPPGQGPERGMLETLEALYGAALDRLGGEMELYRETEIAGITTESEVYEALRGNAVTAVRANSEGELIVSVALPVQRFKAVMGALVLSTEGGDIDAIVRAERIAILRVFLVALAVSMILSFLLARAIARPLRRLTEAARRSGALNDRLIDPSRVHFPDLTRRADEIGYLSGALREMTAALFARLEAIERFAADVAHEIKNPLTSLRSAVQTLRRAQAPEARERLLRVIEHDVRRLDRLVTDISNASRLDAELAREDMGPVDLGQLLSAVAAVADRSRATVAVRIGRAPIVCRGLDGRLGQVFRNLVDNALSFSPAGGRVVASAGPGEEGRVLVTVEDDGPGVPEDRLEQIFERFYSDRPEGEAYGDHSGLGLAISRQIVEAHGGRIWVENRRATAPRGARFVVELPAWTER
jgi:two-component system sensor histidine kinase ChvG